MFMDIQDIRRKNLATWLQTHSVPPGEKSLFSQLKGGGSFGERLARRLESDYGMDCGYLDQIMSAEPAIRGQKTPLSAEAKTLIRWVERTDGLGDQARNLFSHLLSAVELAESLGNTHNQSPVESLIDEATDIEGIARQPSRGTGVIDASRERKHKK